MTLSVVYSRALFGMEAPAVRVETHMAGGLPAFNIVGLADTEVRESRERVRAAIQCIGMSFPAGRITVNLSPADLPKESGRFDLPIAIGVLLSSGQIPIPDAGGGHLALANMVFAGELSLSGALVDVAAPMTIALGVLRDLPDATLVLPPGNARRAAHVPGLTVLAAPTLDAVVRHLCGAQALSAPGVPASRQVSHAPCLSDVKGQPQARHALEVAASGGHSVLFCGWPGVGKSMLAQRLPGLLAPLPLLDWLDVAARFERAGVTPPAEGTRPFRAPHHSATLAALVGGGARPLPGEITLAHHGVLFLDELPEFRRSALEALREPLETGWVALSRASSRVRYPARCQLVAAMNPCPCGWFGHPRRPCVCSSQQVARYRARISGPLLDRVDMQVTVSQVDTDLIDAPGESSVTVGVRVAACQSRQRARQGRLNAEIEPTGFARDAPLSDEAGGLLRQAARQWDWSMRSSHRVLRLSRTLADMAGRDIIDAADVAQAIQYRRPEGD